MNTIAPVPVNLTKEELEHRLIDEFKAADKAYNKASDALRNHFLPIINVLLDAGKIEEAIEVRKRIPSDALACIFAADLIRQAKLKAQNVSNT